MKATNFLLLFVALVLAALLFPLGILCTLILCILRMSMNKALGYLSNTAFSLALSIDLLANVICRDLFNFFLIHAGGYPFGNNRETISRVLGLNKRLGALTDLGRALANLLDFIDPNHTERAAD